MAFFTFGKTIKVVEQENGFQGFYIGAGPYLSVDTTLNIDQQLIDILSSDVDLLLPGVTFDIGTLFSEQLALATTSGTGPGLGSQVVRTSRIGTVSTWPWTTTTSTAFAMMTSISTYNSIPNPRVFRSFSEPWLRDAPPDDDAAGHRPIELDIRAGGLPSTSP